MEKLRLILHILGGFIFLFQTYRLLKEDYPDEEIAKASILGIVWAVGFNYLNNLIGLNFTVFGLILAAVVSVYIFSLKFEWRFWSVMETLTWPGLVCLAVSFGGQIAGVVYLILVLTGFYWRNYRNFRWYPSGKAGFFFLINLNFIALFQIGLDFWQRWLVELSVWSVVLLSGISGIVLLSGREKSN